jgi:hypothetical protein
MEQLERNLGFGEGHASSDEEDAADDDDATAARKRDRQMVREPPMCLLHICVVLRFTRCFFSQDGDREEGLSDEEMEMVRNLDEKIAQEEGVNDDDSLSMTSSTGAGARYVKRQLSHLFK